MSVRVNDFGLLRGQRTTRSGHCACWITLGRTGPYSQPCQTGAISRTQNDEARLKQLDFDDDLRSCSSRARRDCRCSKRQLVELRQRGHPGVRATDLMPTKVHTASLVTTDVARTRVPGVADRQVTAARITLTLRYEDFPAFWTRGGSRTDLAELALATMPRGHSFGGPSPLCRLGVFCRLSM